MSMFSHFTLIELPGKLSQGVPLRTTPQTEEALELLGREECAVKKNNIYLFARPEKDTKPRGFDFIGKYSNECGAKNPKALRSTELRKQIATLSSVLNLKDAHRDQLARLKLYNVIAIIAIECLFCNRGLSSSRKYIFRDQTEQHPAPRNPNPNGGVIQWYLFVYKSRPLVCAAAAAAAANTHRSAAKRRMD
ncbi:hypothetical protein F2P81_024062 [Scophthalmus maximus]|uniref:Uncharacterized protein n=1 Tax=Scophthalmus maximus TaxID=52904 RepID=A0A6A4RWF2_SCOMX|nr:hypothetical protein F2P81_024062 [Scophthalmus maximus]